MIEQLYCKDVETESESIEAEKPLEAVPRLGLILESSLTTSLQMLRRLFNYFRFLRRS